MKFRPNHGQERAINTIDKNVLINAGAGTGKTKVLVERYIKILEDGNLKKGEEIESIVAITFTKKAAEEMTSRIRKNIRGKFKEGFGWRRLYRDIEKSNISTIHSFCSKILRENPVEAKLDPMFEILDEDTGNDLLRQLIQRVLEESLEEDPNTYNLFRSLNINTLEDAGEEFYSIYNDIRNSKSGFASLRKDIKDRITNFSIDEFDLYQVEEKIKLLKKNLAKNARIHRLAGDEKWEKFKNRDYEDDGELVDILLYLEKFLGNSKKEEQNINYIKEKINKLTKVKEKKNINSYIQVLDLLEKIEKEYGREKENNSYLDYDDLQIKTYNLLKNNKKLRNYYQKKYRYIMVDEFQDTNELQKEIFYILASYKEKLDRRNLFVVGDPKQSIYRFRGADLDVFYSVKADIKHHEHGEIINLEENYRTSSKIMDFLNFTFKNIMGDRYDFLSANLKSSDEIEVEVLENQDLIVPEDEKTSNYYRIYEADLIAKRIIGLVEKEGYSYGDIALLFRSGARNHIYESALENYNIPFYNTGGNGFYDKQEILDLENGFRSIFNPLDQIANIGFLRSPMIGMSDTSIFWILKEDGSIYERMLKSLEKNNEDLEYSLIRETVELYDYLSDFMEKNKYSSFFRELVDKTLYKQVVLLNNSGKQSLANIDKYIGMIEDYEEKNLEKSEDIINYLDKISRRRESEATVESEKSNVVKILTIHKSKGLEFPVVIIPELSSGIPGNYSKIKYDKDLGLGLNVEGNRAIYEEIYNKDRLEDAQEMERVLYVAMTRAKNLLILGNQGRKSGFKRLLSSYMDESCCRFIDQINLDRKTDKNIRQIYGKKNKKEGDTREFKSLIEFKDYDSEFVESSSISQYMTFKNCPREYFYRYRLELDPSIFNIKSLEKKSEKINYLPADEKGNIIHDFVENYREGMNRNTLLEKILRKYNRSLINHIEELEVYIDNFIDNLSDNYDLVKREEEVWIMIEGVRFVGYIDRINIKNGLVEIIDYKTNRLSDINSLINYYKPQLKFYAYAISKITNYKVVSSGALFLEDGSYIGVDISDKSMELLMEELRKFTRHINSKYEIEDYDRCKKCNPYCEYDIICNRKD